jgi:hypothetical protein
MSSELKPRRIGFRASLLIAAFAIVGSVGFVSGRTVEGLDPLAMVGLESNSEDQDLRLQRLVGNSIGRQYVAHELIAGRVSFSEAIERFRTFSKHNPDYSWRNFYAAHPGTTEQECFGHQVIAYVKSELSERPEEARTLITRLEAQLFASPGQESLP